MPLPGGEIVVVSRTPYKDYAKWTCLLRLDPASGTLMWESSAVEASDSSWCDYQYVAAGPDEFIAARVGWSRGPAFYLEPARWSLVDGRLLWRDLFQLERNEDVTLCFPFVRADARSGSSRPKPNSANIRAWPRCAGTR